MRSFKRLNNYFKKYWKTILAGSFFLILANVFLVWIPVFIRQTIDEIQQVSTNAGEFESVFLALTSSEIGAILLQKSSFIIGAALIYGLLLFATRQTIIVTSRKIEFDLRNDVFDKLLKLSQQFYSAYDSSNIYTRATEDVNRVREYFGPAFMYTINTLSRAGIILGMMIIVNPELTLWALIPLPLLTYMAYFISGYIHKHSTIIQEQYSDIAERAKEAFSSIRLIKAYNRENYEKKRFEKESESYRVKKLKLDAIESLFHPLLTLLIGMSVIIVIWKGGAMVIEGALTLGNIAEFVIYVAYLTWPVASLGYTVNLYQRSLASWDRITSLLDQTVHISNKNVEPTDLPEIGGDISFNNVSFMYPGANETALKHINLTIKEGENIAIVGKTGSGKSTLLKLIPRLYDPNEGTITLGGVDCRSYPLHTLRKAIGYVPQETFLFSNTITENIKFGSKQQDETNITHVEDAAEKAKVLQNIREFDKQFETVLGERGITLSGGQKQRTAIARALIRDPKVLIFDDSLSAVDTKTEDAILHHLKNEFKNRTTITVSHRISTIKDADKIYVMADGRITETGTHEELIKGKGLYSSMYNKQLLEQELAEI